jgi:hypothetical protein
MSSNASHSTEATTSANLPAKSPTTSEHPIRLALPPIPTAEERHILDVTEGNKVKLDELGPMIINTDGVRFCLVVFV